MKVMKGHRESFRTFPYFSVQKLFILKARKSGQFVEIAGESCKVAMLPGAEENIGKAFLGLTTKLAAPVLTSHFLLLMFQIKRQENLSGKNQPSTYQWM